MDYRTAAGAPTTSRSIEYGYDPFDRRLFKKVDADGTAGPAGFALTDYAYGSMSGADLLVSRNGLGQLTHRYLGADEVDYVLSDEPVGGTTRWAVADHEASIRRLVEPGGSIVADFSYDSFGRPATGGAAPDAVDFLFGYAGGIYDPETGNQYHQARYYDTALGRFLSEDPGSFAGGDANLYRYAQGDPVNRSDPEGLMARLLGGGSLGAAAASAANRAFFSSLGQAPASSPPSSFGSAFSDVNPLLLGDVDYHGAPPISSTPSGSLSPSFNFGTSISSTIASGNYSFVGGASRSLVTSASRPIRVPLTEQQGRAMRAADEAQAFYGSLSAGTTVYSDANSYDYRLEQLQRVSSLDGASSVFHSFRTELSASVNRFFVGEARNLALETSDQRRFNDAADFLGNVSMLTMAAATAAPRLPISSVFGTRAPAVVPNGFVPLAEVEASAADLAPRTGLSSNAAVQRGNLFNRLRSNAYEYSELYIENTAGRRFRLDAYNPGTDIVSRKATQLASISETSAIAYVREAAKKYAPGSKIIDVPANWPLGGTTLQGTLYLEVPIQNAPVPSAVLDAARSYGVTIRDVTGRVH